MSFGLVLDTVPTLIRWRNGVEIERIICWSRPQWSEFFGVDLAEKFPGLPDQRPGCGSKTQDIGVPEALAIKFEQTPFHAREVELGDAEDDMEAMYDRGWTDGLPVVIPTPERVDSLAAQVRRKEDGRIGRGKCRRVEVRCHGVLGRRARARERWRVPGHAARCARP